LKKGEDAGLALVSTKLPFNLWLFLQNSINMN
jgi:hypothetical protein